MQETRSRDTPRAAPYQGLSLSAALSVASVWLGLALSYELPTLPPSTMIIASAVGIYTFVLAAARVQARRSS